MLNKIFNGVLVLRTSNGSHFVRPTFKQRIILLWTFRHFHTLPEVLLAPREHRLVEELARSARPLGKNMAIADQRIGTVEWNAAPEPPKKGKSRLGSRTALNRGF